ncbi:AbiTii domain-containing protein [Arhodomonas sp. SL1]|uniref:AbiTii domain-containing protein n=1 Tax=Arhodomonas sp. SL1 TaxID=3425691 RepID=UPI003F88390B
MTCVVEAVRDQTRTADPVAPAVQRAILLARVLKADPVVQWLKSELNGYAPDAEPPVYRTGDGAVLIAWRPGDGWIQAPIGPNLEKAYAHFEIRTGVEALERKIREEGPRGAARVEFSEQELEEAKKAVQLDTKLCLALPQNAIPTALETVRQALLDWSSELLEQGIQGEGTSFTADERERAAAITEDFESIVANAHERARESVAASRQRRGLFARLFSR